LVVVAFAPVGPAGVTGAVVLRAELAEPESLREAERGVWLSFFPVADLPPPVVAMLDDGCGFFLVLPGLLP
jgi:hypothetical protein